MIVAARLLADLQAELKLFVADLHATVANEADVRGRLQTEWKTAFNAERTGRTFESWVEDRLTQVGVGWILAVVFVRFCEDNHLMTEPMLGGPGDRGSTTRAAQQRYFADRPNDSDREFLQSVFRRAAGLPGLAGLLGDGESPLWLIDPPADACTRLLGRFRATDGDTGQLVHDFTDPALDTRFLGDLYQDISKQTRDDYALLQTPEFIEEFILDRTLTPALEAFGLARTTMIDPACGSGHFLLGAFERVWNAWRTAEPSTSERELAQRALSAVTGVDLNPFAVAIARFRLLVAALRACAITDLRDAPDFAIDVAVGDSLLWGALGGQLGGMEAAATATDRQFLYRTEHAEDLRRIFDKQYAAVAGNPPYIVARDKALNGAYRDRFPRSCSGKFSLAAPFMERLFELANSPDNLGSPAGFVGMITANSFMKREFGKKLVQQCIPRWDLTHVVDTSGAYIPGHGTPTVILLGRHQAPIAPTIRTVLGIQGEPSTPADPAKGLVWSAIVTQIDEPGSESDFVSVADTDRARFAIHPWSIGGGGAAELKERLAARAGGSLAGFIDSIGFHAITGEDDFFTEWSAADVARKRMSDMARRYFVTGEVIRDWRIDRRWLALFPYDEQASFSPSDEFLRQAWPFRTGLKAGLMFGNTRAERGMHWAEYVNLSKSRTIVPLSIAFAFVATHNHFVIDRGGKVFNRSAPVIKLPAGTTIDDHLALLGPLNSAVGCFWMQQVFHNKGASVDAKGARQTTVAWDNFFEHDGTKLRQFPLPGRDVPLELARRLDSLAAELGATRPSAVAAEHVPTRELLDRARAEYDRIFAELVASQEELDWTCLHLYGLTDESLTVAVGEIPPPLALGERAFEIVLARRVAAGEIETAWFTRHRSIAITEPPDRWPDWYRDLVQRRVGLIKTDRDVALVERPEHKRRWSREPWEKLEADALRSWLLDLLESRELWFEGSGDAERAVCRTVAQLADRISANTNFMNVARLWKATVEIDLTSIVGELVADEHVPAQAAARFKPTGLAKRRQWEGTWDLQRVEDRGEPLPDGLDRIPVPPKYTAADFVRSSYWQQRGKLDLPKERFTSIAAAERDTDPTLVIAWAGFDHAQAAQAIGTLIVERQQDGWDAERRWPLVVALAELLPWLDQWHHEVDRRWGASPAQLYRGIAEQHALEAGRALVDITEWQPPAPTRGRRRASTLTLSPADGE